MDYYNFIFQPHFVWKIILNLQGKCIVTDKFVITVFICQQNKSCIFPHVTFCDDFYSLG